MNKLQVIIKKGDYTLLQNKNCYIIAYKYNPEAGDWEYGTYYNYWGNEETKIKFLQIAIEAIMTKTDENYISRPRLEEIASRAIDNIKEDLEDFIDETDLEEHEAIYFGIHNEWEENQSW